MPLNIDGLNDAIEFYFELYTKNVIFDLIWQINLESDQKANIIKNWTTPKATVWFLFEVPSSKIDGVKII